MFIPIILYVKVIKFEVITKKFEIIKNMTFLKKFHHEKYWSHDLEKNEIVHNFINFFLIMIFILIKWVLFEIFLKIRIFDQFFEVGKFSSVWRSRLLDILYNTPFWTISRKQIFYGNFASKIKKKLIFLDYTCEWKFLEFVLAFYAKIYKYENNL